MAFIQAAQNAAAGQATTIAATFGAGVGSGHLVCGCVAWEEAGATALLTPVTVGGVPATIQRRINANFVSFATFYLANVTGAPTTVTATFDGSGAFSRAIIIEEADEIAASGALDVETGQSQVNPGLGTDAVSSGAVTTTAPDDFIFGCSVNTVNVGSDRFAAGTGFTERVEITAVRQTTSEDRVLASAGSVAGTFTATDGDSTTFITMVMAFKAAAGPAQVPSQPWRQTLPIMVGDLMRPS
jgi:hypothetical protein